MDGLLSLLDYGVLLQVDRDFGRVQQRVVDEAVMHGALDALAVLLGEVDGSFDFDAKIIDARHGIFRFVGDDADVRAFSCELEFAEILRGVKSGARC